MRALLLKRQAPIASKPLTVTTMDDPRPGDDEILIEVSACGVCRTDLHVVEGDLPAVKLPVVPGHEAVGRVLEVGPSVTRFRLGDRAGVAWVYRFCGACPYCLDGRENLCEEPVFTGYHRNGGYAEKIVVPAGFAHPLPASLGDDAHVAPLLCAGIIGYRALKRSGLQPGGSIALYGFGGSAHIALQVARAWGCEVFVITRQAHAVERARRLGAGWSGLPDQELPSKVDHAVSFAPAGSVIPHAMRALRKGGTLALAGIYVDRIPELDYEQHLFGERSITSVTANTRQDAAELLELAARYRIETDIEVVPFEQANDALLRMKEDRLAAQAAVLRVAASG